MQHFLRVGGDGTTLASQKKIYANLRQHLRMTDVATYHLMMELGFPIIKPDRVVNRVAIRLGLIEWTGSNGRPLTPRSPARDTDTLGANEAFAWEFQSVIQRLAASTGLSVRKIDYLLVKLGQEVSANHGLYRRNICAMAAPQCNLCRASTLCCYPSRSERRAA